MYATGVIQAHGANDGFPPIAEIQTGTLPNIPLIGGARDRSSREKRPSKIERRQLAKSSAPD
jgi:hypothetical protein